MNRFYSITGAALIAATLGTVATADIPDRPEELIFKELNFTPPAAGDYRYELPSGVRVYMAPSNEFPLVNITFSFKGGSYLVADDKAGLNSMTGSLMRSGGTASMTPAELDEEIAYLAANISTSSGSTTSSASLNALSSNLDDALGIFMDVVRNPRFDDDRKRILVEQSLEGMKQRNDAPGSIMGRDFTRLMYGEDSFQARVSTEATITSITEQDMRDFHARVFHPGNLIIGVSGDFEPQEMLETLEAAIRGWEFGESVPNPPSSDNVPEPGVYYVNKDDVPQGMVRLGHRTVDRDHPDSIAISVMNDILGGGGFTARMMNRLRNDEGLTYGVYTSFVRPSWYPGHFLTHFSTSGETVALALRMAMEEIDKMRSGMESEEELTTTQNSFIETFPRTFESKPAMLGVFINDEWTGRDPNYWATYRDRVRAVTRSDVQIVANEYLRPDNTAILIVGPWEDINRGNVNEVDPNRRASMAEFFGGEATQIALRDPMTQKELPADGGG
ncbi:MAG: M16 family metallopeptidase [Phycisphaerales bacterium]